MSIFAYKGVVGVVVVLDLAWRWWYARRRSLVELAKRWSVREYVEIKT
jgi:hypothetical protein